MEVKTVGVYGAGLMGRGIAQVALEGGYDVVLYNHRTPTLEKGVAGIKKGFEKKVAKGKITRAGRRLAGPPEGHHRAGGPEGRGHRL